MPAEIAKAPQILLVSSWVARGHVGLSAAVPVLQALGCETIALPTIMLSNRPGHAAISGSPVPVDHLTGMRDALAANGWMQGIDAVLTGYFPSADHVTFARETIAQVRALNSSAHVCCDPVVGDHPGGLYIPREVAEAVRDTLVTESDSITPNRFELEWLSGHPITDQRSAVAAARALGVPSTLVTSVPASGRLIANVAVSAETAWSATAPLRSGVPHGTGDAIAAAFLAKRLLGSSVADALSQSTAALDLIVAASAGKDELQLIVSRDVWCGTPAAPVTEVPSCY